MKSKIIVTTLVLIITVFAIGNVIKTIRCNNLDKILYKMAGETITSNDS